MLRKLFYVVFIAVFLLAPGSAPVMAEPQHGGTMIVAYANEPDTMNVYSTHMLGDIQACVVEGLLVPNGDMVYQPVLAEEVPTLENGLIKLTDDGKMTITYKLKRNVTWHDGKPFTAADVKYTWEALMDPAFLAEGKDGTEHIESIETPDDYTVVCYYKYPLADFADKLFTFGILPKHLCEGTDLNQQTGYNRHPVGTGPFVFQEWKPGEYVRLAKNKNYHVEGKPYLDEIVFKFIADQNTQIAQLKTGEVHYATSIPYSRLEEVQKIAGTKTVFCKLNSWRVLALNFKVPAFQDFRVRQAIAHAFDREAMVQKLFHGIPAVWDSPWMPMDPYAKSDVKRYPYDPKKAAELLDEAGWKVGKDGIREKDGMKMKFDYGIVAGRVVDERMQQVIIASLKAVGIEVVANNAAGSTMTGKWNKQDFEMKTSGWITAPGASRTRFYAINSVPPNGINQVGWKNQEVTDLLSASDREMDPAKRKEMLWRVQDIYAEELPEIVLHNTTNITLVVDKLEGFVPNPTNMTNFWDTGSWYLKK